MPEHEVSRPITMDEVRLHEIVEMANGRSKVKLDIKTWIALIALSLTVVGGTWGLFKTMFHTQIDDAITMGTHETQGHTLQFKQVDKNEKKIDHIQHNIYQIGQRVGAKNLKPGTIP